MNTRTLSEITEQNIYKERRKIMRKTIIKRLVSELILDLVSGNYKKIVMKGIAGEYSAQEIEELIEVYGGNLSVPPESDIENINIIKVNDRDEYVIEYELWVDYIKSDLTLSCSIDFEEMEPIIIINDIHVM